MKKETNKCKIYILCAIAVVFIFTCIIASKWDSIFQRGNPIPYLTAAVSLSEDNTFVEIKGMEGIYITKLGDNQDLFRMLEDTYGLEYTEQMGRGYFFGDGKNNFMVESETYWGIFTVWMVPLDAVFSN